MFTANNKTNFSDVFTINYNEKSKDKIVVNIARVDTFVDNDTPCWAGQFYFDMLLTN